MARNALSDQSVASVGSVHDAMSVQSALRSLSVQSTQISQRV